MHTYLVGLLEEVRPVQRKNKQTGEILHSIDATITFSSRDRHGYLVKSTENVNFETGLMPKLEPYKQKYIAIPYVFITSRTGNYLFPDDKMDFISFDKDPFLSSKK